MSGGSDSSAPSSQTVSNVSIPPYAQPYVETMLGQAGALTNINDNPYQTYSGDRTAQFTPLQQQSYDMARLMQPTNQLGTATDYATLAGLGALNTNFQSSNYGNTYGGVQGYDPSQYNMMYTQAPYLQNYQMQGPDNVTGATAQSAQMSAAPQAGYSGLGSSPTADYSQLGNAPQFAGASFQGPGQVGFQSVLPTQMSAAQSSWSPSLQNYQMGPASNVGSSQISNQNVNAAQTGFNANGLQQYQMGNAQQVGTDRFIDPTNAQDYMSPYMQQVVQNQQRDATRQADIASQQRGSRYAQAGAYGGARQAIENSMAARDLALQHGDIMASGLQSAYTNAQQQFNADQARSLQAQQANQGAGLTVGSQNLNANLGVQGLGLNANLQAALANLNNQQQASVMNAANNLQAQGMTASNALQAALANQQAGLTVGSQNLNANLGVQGLGAQLGSQMALANLGNQQQANQYNSQSGLQAALANQQAGMNTGQFNAQMGYNTGMQNAQFAQQAGLANQGLMGQYGLQQGQMNQGVNLANQALAGQYGLTGAGLNQAVNLANQGMQGQYGMQQGQFDQAANMANAGYGQQANLANQTMGYNVGNANLQALLGVQGLGSGQNMQSQLANQGMNLSTQQAQEAANQYMYNQLMQQAGNYAQYGQAANQLNQQSAQYGAGLGLQGLQTALSGAGQLGSLGANQYNQQMGIANLQNQYGTQQQQQVQNILNQQYQDFLNQQRYPYQQLDFMSGMLRGLPMSQTTSSMYQAAPNPISQIAGLGGAAYTLGRARKGGKVKDFEEAKITREPGGLHKLALDKLH